ncbi:uncharacterized protein BDW43DRAFT_281956 [Aspergillus alliaceus]|uniref:uncharacterized protein n=1 Tax=Petromyces alliaceus TaxID=209559 RepID=UPI0012A76937|nr:uncharacterized protein BDW43DRAFT_281956 [Aspergillus alliaceus]KAB8231611.1 hypothetical protein BDW43DRAFT_281956 [Aspergillus alliaceus]
MIPKAETIMSGLRKNKDLEEMLYCCPDQLDARQDVSAKAGKHRKTLRLWVLPRVRF